MLLLGFEVLVDLLDQLVRVSAVNFARHLDGLAASGRTAEAVHADFEEELRRLAVEIQNLADDRILGYSLFSISSVKFNTIILYPENGRLSTAFRQNSCKISVKFLCVAAHWREFAGGYGIRPYGMVATQPANP